MNAWKFQQELFIDSFEGLGPNLPWFKEGSFVRVISDLIFFIGCFKLYQKGCIFVYLGVSKDLVIGKEQHWFLTNDGQIVDWAGNMCDFSWRYSAKSMFEEA